MEMDRFFHENINELLLAWSTSSLKNAIAGKPGAKFHNSITFYILPLILTGFISTLLYNYKKIYS